MSMIPESPVPVRIVDPLPDGVADPATLPPLDVINVPVDDLKPLPVNAIDHIAVNYTPDQQVEKFLSGSAQIRKWIYNVAITLLIIVSIYQTGHAMTTQNWADLFSVVLNLGGVGAVSLARANVRDA